MPEDLRVAGFPRIVSLPLEGKADDTEIPLPPSNLHPFGAPPSVGRREYTREPLPLEGAAERSEAGLASFFAAKPPPLCLPGCVSGIAAFSYRSLPHWGRGTASAVDRVLSYNVDLRRSFPLVFHTTRTLSGSLRSPPSPRGEGFVSSILLFSTYPVFALTLREKRRGARHIWGKRESLGKDFSLCTKWRYRDLMSPSLIPSHSSLLSNFGVRPFHDKSGTA